MAGTGQMLLALLGWCFAVSTLAAAVAPLLSPPALAGAWFSDGGSTVTLRFNTPTDRGGLRESDGLGSWQLVCPFQCS